MTKKVKDTVKIIPIGGLGAIGRNMTVFEYQGDILVVDCGILFPEDDIPGIDFIIPDFSYLVQNKKRIRGIVVTHGHEDHIGAIPFLLKEISAPIYATKLTLGFIQSRLAERRPKKKPIFIEMSPRDIVHIGGFIVEFISVNHSIVGGVGLAIQTPVGTIIHSGDFKIDHFPVDSVVTDIYRFAEYGERGVLLLMSDSTNADVEGYTQSESILNEKLYDIFSKSRGRMFVASFASNINRIQQVLDAARRYNRKVVISGMSIEKNIMIAHELGYLAFKDDLFVDIKKVKKLPHKKQVIVCTGTQGEPMSALTRIANGTHKQFAAGAGDIVIITASIIPGNERMVSRVINSLMRVGAEVYYEQDEHIHVSGHAAQEELKLMISLTKPKYFLPIHGEFRHLKAHTKIAESYNIKPSRIMLAENGDILELSERSFEKAGALKIRDTFVEGRFTGDIESAVIKDRKMISQGGIIVIILPFSKGRLMGEPEIVIKGMAVANRADIIGGINQNIENRIEKLVLDGASGNEIAGFLKKDIQNYLYKTTRTSPVVEIKIIEL